MVQMQWGFIILTVLMSVYNTVGETLCPIGFKLAHTKHKGTPICYRMKGPEAFADKFIDCAGNLFTSELYYDLDIMETDVVLWTDYKSSYPGGPFVNWSYTNTTGRLFSTSTDVFNSDSLDTTQELCVVIDPISKYISVSCDGSYYRYCFVEPYDDDETITKDGCEDFEGSSRFSSPITTCLTSLAGVGGGTMRATWQQAKELCEKRGGSLLNKGWPYSNHPILSRDATSPDPIRPLGIYSNAAHTVINYIFEKSSVKIPKSEWHFEAGYLDLPNIGTLGAIQDDSWYLANNTDIFYNIICEKTIHLEAVTLDLTIDSENKIILSSSAVVNKNLIYCFTDSVMYYPESVQVVYDEVSDIFIVKPKKNGYYWCVHIDSRNFNVSESNRILFIREKTSLINVYAVKMKLKNKYSFDSIDKIYKSWEKKLKEYIFYGTKYTKVHGIIDTTDRARTEKILRDFKSSYPRSELRDKDIIIDEQIKRLYLDSKTVLVHINLNPEMNAVPPGMWDNLEIISMKPVYYCKGVDSVTTLSLAESTTTPGCRIYKCTGDFNEGVQWLITSSDSCDTSTTVTVSGARSHAEVSVIIPTVGTMVPDITTRDVLIREHGDSSEESIEHNISTTTTAGLPTTVPDTIVIPDTVVTVSAQPVNITTLSPRPPRPSSTTPRPDPTTTEPPAPTTRPPPQEQLNQVMADLQKLIDNDTVPIFVENIDGAFNQVDELLAESDDLEIPGELLHLLDGIGSRLQLNDTEEVATAVRGNIALLAADAQPGLPVTGLRIKNMDNELFTQDAFDIIRHEVNSSYLNSSDSDMLVQLPPSVAASTRRISFVVFRTDRAFQSNAAHVAVNSRVLSVNVENFTEFDNGEGINIHFSPFNAEPEENQTRVCAFWQFLDDGTGHWSDDGCRFIPATTSGLLDTCRCDHLTHFAEILMPRTSLSSGHELALELISVIGCCMSILGLLMIGLTAILFRSWRRDFSNKIWLQLCIAIFIVVTCFMVAVYAGFKENSFACMFFGILLHYSVLASFCWMLVAAILSYRRLVTVFTRDVSHKLLKASAFSWGAPCAVVGILLSVDPQSYAGQFDGTNPNGAFCYPSGLGLWLSVYAPVAVMLLANWTLFILIVRSVFASRRIPRHGDSNEALRCVTVSCLLVFLFGLPWVFALFLENIVTLYLFALTASYQGFVLFVFFILGNKKTRDLWLNKLKIRQTRKIPVTSSTYTNRSTGNAGLRGGNTTIGSNSIEAKVTKPKSLASSDNSRFS